MNRFFGWLCLLALGMGACGGVGPAKEAPTAADAELARVPDWAERAVWYQIFVERFRNGDASNDPTAEDIFGAYPGQAPPGWKITPWSQDWYRPDEWFEATGLEEFHQRVQLRRYGGDLRGVLDQLDHLQRLGVNAIYFNPLNDAPSLHKYDPRHYRHIDRNFGPDPRGDAAVTAGETPDDPTTWRWTAADRLFLEVVEELHRRGMRVIVDYSWNHTGKEFWALRDVRAKGPKSKFAEWYEVESYDDPATSEDEFRYRGWFGIPYLAEFRKRIVDDDGVMPFEGDLASDSLRRHIFAVTRRWLDPNGDGDPSDGVDGFRLDVAAEVPMGFWREYRRQVRAVNPDAVLIGEIWWREWPHSLMDPRPFLNGDMFDSIMNYRWYRAARGFFAQGEPRLTAAGFVEALREINRDIAPDRVSAMMNLTAGHDSPRTLTSLFNKGLYKYRVKPNEDPDFKIHRPDSRTRRELQMLLIHQFTFPGAPHIWNGDEVGMWGGDDPDTRKPLVWADLRYEDETAHPLPDRTRPRDKVEPDMELFGFYARLAALRRSQPVLSEGEIDYRLADDASMTLAYGRTMGEEEAVAAFNRSEAVQSLTVPTRAPGRYVNALEDGEELTAGENGLSIQLQPLEAVILLRRPVRR